MKLLKSALLGLLIISLAVSGCKKDEEESNYLQVGDKTVTLSDGNIKYYGDYSATSWNFDLDFVSPEITLSTDESGNPDYTGVGARVYFEVYSASSTKLNDGDYTYLNDGTYAAGTYDEFSYTYDYNGDYTIVDGYEGTLTVKNNGNNSFVIDFSGKDENSNVVKLHYNGTLHYYDRSNIAK